MAVTESNYTVSNSSTTNYSFTFPYLKTTDVKLSINGVASSAFSFANATTIQLNSNPTVGDKLRIYRETDDSKLEAEFFAGSAIKSSDLNDNFNQNLYVTQESNNKIDAAWTSGDETIDSSETWASNNNRVATTGAIDGQIDAKIDTALTTDVAAGNKITVTDNSPGSGQITIGVTSGSLVDSDVNASAAIAGSKLQAATGGNAGSLSAADKTKLDNVETAATADQTNAEIRAAVEAASDSNVFTDADHSKLNGIESGATADQTNAEIRAAVEAASDSNVFTDADHSKLDGIDSGAKDDQTASEIKSLIATSPLDASHLDANSVGDSEIITGALDNRYYTETELNAGQLDNRYYTETEADSRFYNLSSGEEIQSGEAWSAADNKIATTAAIDARITDLVDDVGGFVPIVNETSFPAANPDVNNGAGTLVSVKEFASSHTPSGGNVTIANGAGSGNTVTITGCGSTVLAAGFGGIVETTSTLHTYAFHRLTPKATEVTTVAGNITNINAVANNATNINAVNSNATNINTVAGNNANITTVAGINSNVTSVAGNSTNINAVNSNSSNINTVAGSISNVNTTAGSISNVNTVATNISNVNDFSDKYRVASSAPSSSLDEGDLWFDTTNDELKVYSGSSWQGGVTATGGLLAKSGGQMTGNLTFSGSQTVDGRDVSADGTKLDGIASGAEVNVQSDWNATTGDARILNKPTLFSGSYTDLSNKPTIPTNNNQLSNGSNYVTSSIISSLDAGNLSSGKVPIDRLGSSGTASSSTYLRGDNSWQTISTGLPSGGTFTADVTFTGDNYDLVWDKSDNALELEPQAKLKVGNNTEIFEWSSGNFQISSTGSYNLQFDANGGDNYFSQDGMFTVENAAHNSTRLKAKSNGVELYASGTKRLDVNTSGATITGTCTAGTFAGSGANLTNIDSSAIVNGGSFPAINASNLTNLTAGNLTGTLPAINGSNLTNITIPSSISGDKTFTGSVKSESQFLLDMPSGGAHTCVFDRVNSQHVMRFKQGGSNCAEITVSDSSAGDITLHNMVNGKFLCVSSLVGGGLYFYDGTGAQDVLHENNIGSGGKLANKNVYVNQIHGDGSNLTNLPSSSARDFTPTNTIGATKPAVAIDSSGNATEVVVESDTVFKNDQTQNSIAWLNNQNTTPNYGGSTNTAYCTINGIDYIVSVWVDNGNNDYGWYRCGKIDTTVDSSNRTIVWGTAAAFASQSMPRQGLSICALNNTGRFVIEGGYYSGWNSVRYHCATIDTGNLNLTFQTNNGSGDQLGGTTVYTSQRHTPNWALVCKSDDAAVAVIQEGYYTRPRIGMIIHSSSTHRTSSFESLTADMRPEGPFTLAIESTGTGSKGVFLCYRANSGSDMYAKHILTPTDANISYNGISQTWTSGSTNTGLGWYGTEKGINSGRIPGQNSYWVSLVKPATAPWTNQVQVLTYDYGGTTITYRHLTYPSISGSGLQIDNRLYGFWDYNASKLILHWNRNDSNVQKLETSYGTPGVFGTGFSFSTPVIHDSLHDYGQIGGPAQWGVSRTFDRQPPLQLSNNPGIYLTSGAVDYNYGRIYMEFLSVSPKQINNDTFVGFATAASGGGSVNVALPGSTITSPLNGVTLTTGKTHYLDMNAGQTAPTLTTTQTSTGKAVGVALSASVLLIQ